MTAYFDCTQAIISRMIANWTTTPIVYDNMDFEPQGTVSISATNDISAASADNSFNSVAGNFSTITAGQFIKVNGFTVNAVNNGYFKVVTKTNTKITVTGATLITEAIGALKTIVIDDQTNPFVYFAVDFRDSAAITLGTSTDGNTRYRLYGNIEAAIFTPVNSGVGLGMQYADTISSVFRGQTFLNVVCLAPEVSSGRQVKFATDNWWSTPVFIPFEYNTLF